MNDWKLTSGCRASESVSWERWIGGIRLIAVHLSPLELVVDGLTEADYKAYEQVVDATHRFKSIFYDSNE